MIASYIALTAVGVFVVRFAWRSRRNASSQAGGQTRAGKAVAGAYAFLAGALFANAIPHFLHGITGQYFPAPFFRNLGRGIPTDAANVIWGLFCAGAGYWLVSNYHARIAKRTFLILLGCGFALISLFLSVVFAHWIAR